MRHVPDGPFRGETNYGKKWLGTVKNGILYTQFSYFLREESKVNTRCCQISNDITDSDLKGVDYCYSYEGRRTGRVIHKHRYQSLDQIRKNVRIKCGAKRTSRYIIIMKEGKKVD